MRTFYWTALILLVLSYQPAHANPNGQSTIEQLVIEQLVDDPTLPRPRFTNNVLEDLETFIGILALYPNIPSEKAPMQALLSAMPNHTLLKKAFQNIETLQELKKLCNPAITEKNDSKSFSKKLNHIFDLALPIDSPLEEVWNAIVLLLNDTLLKFKSYPIKKNPEGFSITFFIHDKYAFIWEIHTTSSQIIMINQNLLQEEAQYGLENILTAYCEKSKTEQTPTLLSPRDEELILKYLKKYSPLRYLVSWEAYFSVLTSPVIEELSQYYRDSHRLQEAQHALENLLTAHYEKSEAEQTPTLLSPLDEALILEYLTKDPPLRYLVPWETYFSVLTNPIIEEISQYYLNAHKDDFFVWLLQKAYEELPPEHPIKKERYLLENILKQERPLDNAFTSCPDCPNIKKLLKNPFSVRSIQNCEDYLPKLTEEYAAILRSTLARTKPLTPKQRILWHPLNALKSSPASRLNQQCKNLKAF